MLWLAAAGAFVVGGALFGALVYRLSRKDAFDKVGAARLEAQTLRRAVELEAAAIVQSADADAREAAIERRAAATREEESRIDRLARREERAGLREAATEKDLAESTERL